MRIPLIAATLLFIGGSAHSQTRIFVPEFGSRYDNNECDVVVEGEIFADAFDVFAEKLADPDFRPWTMCLNSSGGSIEGALALGSGLWNSYRILTRLYPGDACLSSCVFLWLAGRGLEAPNRFNLGGTLAIHGFYYDSDEDAYTGSETVQYTKSIASWIVEYLDMVEAHPKLGELIFDSSPNEWTEIVEDNGWLVSPGLYCLDGFRKPLTCS